MTALSSWNTALTKAFSFVRVPIVSAPMAGVAGGLMAAETCRAGGLGFIAAGYNDNLQQVEHEIDVFRRHAPPTAPLSLGFIGFAALQNDQGWERYEYLLQKYQPQVVQFFAPSIMFRNGSDNKGADDDGDAQANGMISNVQLAQHYNAKFMAQIGTAREAKDAVSAGVDCIIAQGLEAGGHGMRRDRGSSTLTLSSLLVQTYKNIPIIAAGGIMNGQGMAAALALGCSGVVLGTRLWASTESIGSPAVQAHLLGKTCDDVIRTTVFDQLNNAAGPVTWPSPYDSVGALRNELTRQWDGRYDDLQQELAKPDSKVLAKYKQGHVDVDSASIRVLCGEGVGHVESIDGTYDIIMRIEQDAKDRILCLSSVLPE